MKTIKVNEQSIEFYEEKDVIFLFDKLLQAAGKRGVPEKVIEKAKKRVLKLTRKGQKKIDKGKPDPSLLRDLRNTIKRLEDITRDPSSYTGNVIEEILKAL